MPESLVAFEHAVPSATHMALLALHRAGCVKYIVTQNVDGLHTRVRKHISKKKRKRKTNNKGQEKRKKKRKEDGK